MLYVFFQLYNEKPFRSNILLKLTQKITKKFEANVCDAKKVNETLIYRKNSEKE